MVAHCRAGFERECAADLQALGIDAARIDAQEKRAYVVATLAATAQHALGAALARRPPVFARSMFFAAGTFELGTRDRITPILDAAAALGTAFGAIWLETPDSDEGRTRSAMCRRLAPLLDARASSLGLLAADATCRLHVLFVDAARACIGTSDVATGSPWPMGIPRIGMPREAPSRSTMKLAEAFVTFMRKHEMERWLRPAMRAVDLGAAPGGWTWQLASRGLRVIAIDNGNLATAVANDPLVEHLRTDGFRFRPKRPVDWMVCDMVEQPSRIAALAARWIATGDCRRTIFNLKLPMKKRHAEVERCREIVETELDGAGLRHHLRIRQLYHDREEVTAFCTRA